MITQNELVEYDKLKTKIAKAEMKIKLVKAQMKDTEETLLFRVLGEEEQEKGALVAFADSFIKRASISWKAVVEELKGRAFVEQKIADAPRDEAYKLVIRLQNNGG